MRYYQRSMDTNRGLLLRGAGSEPDTEALRGTTAKRQRVTEARSYIYFLSLSLRAASKVASCMGNEVCRCTVAILTPAREL